jgi:hypothetical protein
MQKVAFGNRQVGGTAIPVAWKNTFLAVIGALAVVGTIAILSVWPKPETKQQLVVASKRKTFIKKCDNKFALFPGFSKLSQRKKLEEITKLLHVRTLPPEGIAFLKAEVANKSLWPVTRNNIANVLLNQETRDPKLYLLFIAMYDDYGESPLWKDYCLQFLAKTISFASEPDKVQAKLHKVANTCKGSYAGTAILQLAHYANAEKISLNEEFSAMLGRRLKENDLSVKAKMSILAVIGMRHRKEHIVSVRKCLQEGKRSGLIRAALGALGVIGSKDDEAIIRSFVGAKNLAVGKAARAALNRLSERKNVVEVE